MNALFLVICGVSVVFFVVFLVECSRSPHKPKKPWEFHKSQEADLIHSPTGRRFFIYLERQMAEFLSVHHRTVALFVVATALFLMPHAAQAQKTQPTPRPPAEAEQEISPAVQKQLDAMQKRIDQLETELANQKAQEEEAAEERKVPSHAVAEQPSGAPAPPEGAMQMAAAPGKPAKPEPFSFADFTWLNGNPRIKEVPFDTKFFTPEIRSDVSYIYDFNHPQDDTIGGSSEIFRASEFQLTQLGVGGDFHWDNVQARLMTQFGMYSQTHAA